LANTTSPI